MCNYVAVLKRSCSSLNALKRLLMLHLAGKAQTASNSSIFFATLRILSRAAVKFTEIPQMHITPGVTAGCHHCQHSPVVEL